MSLWVKLCGARTEGDIGAARAAGADAVGVVMTPSLRMVDIATATRLVEAAAGEMVTVGVFYRPDRTYVERIRDEVPFDLFQAEPESLLDVGGISTLPVVHDRAELPEAVTTARGVSSDGRVLVESSGRGGTGTAPNWDRVAALGGLDMVVIAGGLTPANVAAAVSRLHPGGVDVSSGIESSPGEKDADLMRRFVEMARGADSEVIG